MKDYKSLYLHYQYELNIVISIFNSDIIQKIVSNIKNSLVHFPNIIAPNTVFLDRSSLNIGKGNVLFLNTRVSCEVTIGDFNLVNSLSSFGHDARIGNYNILAPSTRISGECVVGNNNFFGVQSIVLQGLKIGSRTRIGANSVVMRNTKDDSLYLGNPAKRIVI